MIAPFSGWTKPIRSFLPLAFGMAAFLFACRAVLKKVFLESAEDNARYISDSYNFAILAPNYILNGFVRRGLNGTLMTLMDWAFEVQYKLFLFHFFCALFLVVPAITLLWKLAQRDGLHWMWFGLVFVLSPQMVRAWAYDIGRGDMLVAGLVCWAAILAQSGRYKLASVTLIIGYLSHETAIIFGVPLVVGVWAVDQRATGASLKPLLSALGILLGLMIAVVAFQVLFSDSALDVARTIRESGEPNTIRDGAAYLNTTGFRLLKTSACMSISRNTFFLTIFVCFFSLILYSKVLMFETRFSLAVFALFCLVPFAVMSIIAIDYGRWLMMATFDAWILSVILRLKRVESVNSSPSQYVIASTLLLVLLLMKPTDAIGISGATRKLAPLLLSKPDFGSWSSLDYCDPDWRLAINPNRSRP